MNRRVPAVATWFLERFGVTRQNEALIGDLAEEYQAGKSRMWYWWQALVAIAVAVFRDVRQHKLLALRSVALAWIVSRGFFWFSENLSVLTHRYHVGFRWYIPATWSQWTPFPAWDQWDYSLQTAFIVGLGCSRILIWAVVGWLVARIHRAQAGAMVVTVLTWRILLFAWGLYSFLTNPYFQRYLLTWLTWELTEIFLVAAGGLLALAVKQPEPSITIAS